MQFDSSELAIANPVKTYDWLPREQSDLDYGFFYLDKDDGKYKAIDLKAGEEGSLVGATVAGIVNRSGKICDVYKRVKAYERAENENMMELYS